MITKPEVEVVIVEDDDTLRRALERLLQEAGYVVQTFASAEDYLVGMSAESCHCLLLDVRLPGLSGVALQQRLLNQEKCRSIVFMTGHGSIPAAVEAIKKGAVDYLTKPIEEKDLLIAVEKALQVQKSTRADTVRRKLAKSRLNLLTRREIDVLRLVVAGLPNKVIGFELGIALPTVKIHRGRVMEKMEATSLVDLVGLAELAGLQAN